MEIEIQHKYSSSREKPNLIVRNEKVGKNFYINPKKDCPHINDKLSKILENALESLGKGLLTVPCRRCHNEGENWICLSCQGVYCSRNVSGKINNSF